MARKSRAERDQEKHYMAANPKGPNPWEEIAKAIKVEREIYNPLLYLERNRAFNSNLAVFARLLVRAAEEKSKPNGDRLREYRDSALPSLEQRLFSSAPVYKNFETVTLGRFSCPDAGGTGSRQLGGQGRPERQVAGRSGERVLIGGTKLDDVAVRKQLYEGGKAAVDASTDPLIVMMRT